MKYLFFGSIGVMAETSNIQRNCYNQALQEYNTGLYWNVASYCELIRTPGGLDRLERLGIASDIAQKIHQRKQTLFASAIADGVPARAGITSLIAYCKAHGIEMAFVTSTTRQTIDGVMQALSHEVDFDSFNAILSAEHVSRPKPDPAIYHLAMEKCGATNTDDVLVIEDTLANCAAAQAAGLRSVFYPGEFALTTHYDEEAQSLSIERCLQAVAQRPLSSVA